MSFPYIKYNLPLHMDWPTNRGSGVAQLVDRSLPIPEIRGQGIESCHLSCQLYRRDENMEKKSPRMDPLKNSDP